MGKKQRKRPIVTLTTDFGLADSYVAQMKGVLLGLNSRLTVVDVTHAVPPQDVVRGAAVLCEAAEAFPPRTIHVAVVDPGVGGDRPIVAVKTPRGRFVAPDNGLLGLIARQWPPTRIVRVTEPRFWRQPVSSTFHGRDVMAPVAAHWSLGRKLSKFGPAYDGPLIEPPVPVPRQEEHALVGEVLWADSFGNLVTNIAGEDLPAEGERLTVEIAGRRIDGVGRYYGEHPPGALLALIGSSGRLEIAVNQGNAATTLPGGAGEAVRVVVKES